MPLGHTETPFRALVDNVSIGESAPLRDVIGDGEAHAPFLHGVQARRDVESHPGPTEASEQQLVGTLAATLFRASANQRRIITSPVAKCESFRTRGRPLSPIAKSAAVPEQRTSHSTPPICLHPTGGRHRSWENIHHSILFLLQTLLFVLTTLFNSSRSLLAKIITLAQLYLFFAFPTRRSFNLRNPIGASIAKQRSNTPISTPGPVFQALFL